MAVFTDTAITAILLSWAFFIWRYYHKSSRIPSPPGPPSDPIFGHLRVFPARDLHNVFHAWSKIHGDVIQLRTFGRSTIILNSAKAANDLFDDRSSIYSCRAKTHLLDLLDVPPVSTNVQYGKDFFKQRRILNKYLNRRLSSSYETIQRKQAHILLRDLLRDPSDYTEHIFRYATSIVVRIAFGYETSSAEDPFLGILGAFIKKNQISAGPVASTIVDLLPFLKYMPSWFPGTFYVNLAKELRPLAKQMWYYPYQILLKHIAKGNAEACLLASELEENTDPEHIRQIQGVALAFYFAGSSTVRPVFGSTAHTLHVFLLAMVLYPEIRRKVQEELEAVTGPDRLPDFSDRDVFPYLECVLKETLRWNPVVPLGIPHRLIEPDMYRGMYIPKGSIVIPNIYGMTRDEAVYHNPEEFNPSRFLPKPEGLEEPDPRSIIFGWGRRICPGRFLADGNLFIAMATILSAFDISKAMDENGKEITPDVEFDQAFTR
ncbi:cytochrome P450 [Mycena floridula]|nr:cytochrome P450 [Mycena floridula]